MENVKKYVNELSRGEKIKHYFSYYGIPAAIISIIIAVAVWMVTDIATKEKFDLVVMYSTSANLSDAQSDAISAALADYAVDVTGDGNVSVAVKLMNLSQLNPDEVEIYDVMMMYHTELMQGDSTFYIMDKEQVQELAEEGILRNIEDIAGDLTDDGYSIELVRLTALREIEVFRNLPSDCVIAIKSMPENTNEKIKPLYENARIALVGIIEQE